MESSMESESSEDDVSMGTEEHYETFTELEPVIELIGIYTREVEAGEAEDLTHLNEVEALQHKLRKQENLIDLLAKASEHLLNIYYRAKDNARDGCSPEEDQLREKVMQLTFHNNSLQEQLKDLEQQLLESDHKVEDLLGDRKKLSTASLLTEHSYQTKLKELQKDNSELSGQISDLLCDLKSRERQLFAEGERTKNKLAHLQGSLNSKEAEVLKLEDDKKALKKELRLRKKQIMELEIEAEELHDELESSRKETSRYVFLFERSEQEIAEYRDMLMEARRQLNEHVEKMARARFNIPNSPYFDPDSLASELDKVSRDKNQCDLSTSEYGTWPDDTSSISCDDVTDTTLEIDTIDGGGGGDTDAYYHLNFQGPMGQPGQPGTFDLDMALDRLECIRLWKARLYGNHRPALTYSQDIPPRISRGLRFECDMSLFSSVTSSQRSSARLSFPIMIKFPLSPEGLNGIGNRLCSGIKIRGVSDSSSILDFEEDEVDASTPQRPSSLATSSQLDTTFDQYRNGRGGIASSTSSPDIVPTFKSMDALMPRSIFGRPLTPQQQRQPQGVVFRRAALDDGSAAQNGKEQLPDCIVS